MANSEFSEVQWSNDSPLTPDALQQMSSNDNYLRDYKPDIYLLTTPDGAQTQQGIKIMAGIKTIPKQPKNATASIDIRFKDGVFAPGSIPVVTVTLATSIRRTHATISGLRGDRQPDENGFTVHVAVNQTNPKNNSIDERIYVHWQAVGY